LEVRLQEDGVRGRLHPHDEALGDLATAALVGGVEEERLVREAGERRALDRTDLDRVDTEVPDQPRGEDAPGRLEVALFGDGHGRVRLHGSLATARPSPLTLAPY